MKIYGIKEEIMILIAVIVGYVLGIAPFIYIKLLERQKNTQVEKQEEKIEDKTQEILDEWLNGAKEVNKVEVTQEDLYEEYTTGIVKKGE